MTALRRVAGAALAVPAVLLALTAAAAPAAAHPLGPPQRMEITANGPTVEVRWQAAGDDLTALALHLGVLESGRSFVYEDGAPVPEESDESHASVLGRSPKLATYLLDHVAVAQDGRTCSGQLVDAAQLAEQGALLRFWCPGEVDDVTVEASLLTDLHPAYRTVAVGVQAERAMYSRHAPVHTWSLGARSQTGPADTAVSSLVASGVGVSCAAVASLLVWRRRRTGPRSAG